MSLVGCKPTSRKNHDVGGGCACKRISRCMADEHARKETCVKKTRMQKRKVCKECMQEYLAKIGLGF
jgi:hypothetical protein